jgi:DNA-binding MarR family transcriptional regulator
VEDPTKPEAGESASETRSAARNGARKPARSGAGGADDDTAGPRIDMAGIDKAVGYVVRRAQVWMFKDVKRAFEGLDISPAQYSVLKIINANPGLAQARVADALSIERARLVLMLDRLQDRGLIERARSEADRRSHALHLTDSGRELLGRLHALIREHDRRVMERIGPEGAAEIVRILSPFLD